MDPPGDLNIILDIPSIFYRISEVSSAKKLGSQVFLYQPWKSKYGAQDASRKMPGGSQCM